MQWPKAEPGHLPQTCQVPIKQLDRLEQCAARCFAQRNAFGNTQLLELLHIPHTVSWFDWGKASKISEATAGWVYFLDRTRLKV